MQKGEGMRSKKSKKLGKKTGEGRKTPYPAFKAYAQKPTDRKD